MSELVRELYSLLIPLKQERLQLPRMCVAEVIAFAEPERPATDLPDWYLGTVDWNGRQLPVLALEAGAAETEPRGRRRARTRIVVLHGISGALPGGHYGILTQGFPQLVRVNADVVKPDTSRTFPERMPVLCQVRMINETPLVPDLERLEEIIAQETTPSS